LFIIIIFLIGAFIYVAFKIYEPYAYKSAIPEKLGPIKTLYVGGHAGLREGCGAAIFHLTKETTRNIEKENINFFQNASKYRNNKRGYSQWYKSPINESVTEGKNNTKSKSYGAYDNGLSCLKKERRNANLIKSIRKAYHEKGSYYAVGHESVIFVSPELRIVVFTYFG